MQKTVLKIIYFLDNQLTAILVQFLSQGNLAYEYKYILYM